MAIFEAFEARTGTRGGIEVLVSKIAPLLFRQTNDTHDDIKRGDQTVQCIDDTFAAEHRDTGA